MSTRSSDFWWEREIHGLGPMAQPTGNGLDQRIMSLSRSRRMVFHPARLMVPALNNGVCVWIGVQVSRIGVGVMDC